MLGYMYMNIYKNEVDISIPNDHQFILFSSQLTSSSNISFCLTLATYYYYQNSLTQIFQLNRTYFLVHSISFYVSLSQLCLLKVFGLCTSPKYQSFNFLKNYYLFPLWKMQYGFFLLVQLFNLVPFAAVITFQLSFGPCIFATLCTAYLFFILALIFLLISLRVLNFLSFLTSGTYYNFLTYGLAYFLMNILIIGSIPIIDKYSIMEAYQLDLMYNFQCNDKILIIKLTRLVYNNPCFQMSYFYPEEITYCECIVPRQIGWEVMNELGQQQVVHFQHKQINYENPYTKSLKRCQEAIAKINDIKNFINQFKHKFKPLKVKSYKDLLKQFDNQILSQKIHGHLYINEIQDQIKGIYEYLSRERKQSEKIQKDLDEKITNLVLIMTLSASQDFKTIAKNKSLLDRSNLFDYKAILINRKDLVNLQKGLFRISRGHCWLKTLNIDTQSSDSIIGKDHQQFFEQKVVCIIMFQFGQNNILLNKINRYISCIENYTLNVPINKLQTNMNELKNEIRQIQNIKALTNDAIQRYLHKVFEPYKNTQFSLITYLEAYALKQRQVYKKLACTNQSKSFLHFNIFIPTKSLPLKLNLNQKLPPLTLTPKQCRVSKPTKFDSNQIMVIPQQILNTYGVPTYGQFNPAVFYIVTFGFFIGVMFGDVGHMLMAIPLLIYFNANVWAWTIIFFMGYCGIIYNQFFGLNLGLFTSCYEIPAAIANSTQVKVHRINPDCVYPIGVDSIWKGAQNQMQYVNSYKMKLAVILGVVHMMLGLAIKVINIVRKRNWLSLFTLAIPQIIFMLCTFVYMDFLIIFKWNTDYSGAKSMHAPSIIGTMITSFAGFGAVNQFFWGNEKQVQKLLATIAYLMVPIMLIGTPLGIYIKRRKSKINIIELQKYPEQGFNELIDEKIQPDNRTGSQDGMTDRIGSSSPSSLSMNYFDKDMPGGHHKQQMSQIVVHSFIETIQYVLGTVSNTASYLRLWALSLAHGQLSEVIFSLILKSSISEGYRKIPSAFFAFMFYYLVTFGVLICMDSMQCFLHSLRLHWVQFQNKFYEGKGYKFQPFNFKLIYQK